MLAMYFQLFAIFGAIGFYIGGLILCFVVLVAAFFVRGALHDLGRLLRWMWRKAGSKAS